MLRISIAQLSILLFLMVTRPVYTQPMIVLDPEEFHFELPYGVNDAGPLNVANFGDSLLVVRVDRRRPRRDPNVNILIWTRFTNENLELPNILTSLASLEVDYRVTLYDGTSIDEMDELLERANVFIVPDQQYGSDDELYDLGASFEDILQNFVSERGGYVIGSDCSGETAAFLRGADLIDIDIVTSGSRFECEAADMHPLNVGIQDYTAMFGSNIHTCDDEDAIPITRARDRDANHVTARTIGRGGVVYIGSDWWAINPEMTQLMINAVMWFMGGSNWLIFEPFDGNIQPNSSENLFFTIISGITSMPDEYLQEIMLYSNDPERPMLAIPVYLTVTEWLPAELTLEPDEIFMITEPDADSLIIVIARNIGGGFLEADLELEDDTDWVTINHNRIDIGPGLTDRIALQFHGGHTDGHLRRNWLIFSFENPDPVLVELPITYYEGEEFGSIEGNLTDAETNEPVSNASVNLHGIKTISDDEGHFEFDRVPTALFRIKVSHPDYLDQVIIDVLVRADLTTHVNAVLYYCDLEMDFEEQVVQMLQEESHGSVIGEFVNTGNGTLNYKSDFKDVERVPNLGPWQVRFSLASGEITTASEIYGAIFNGENLILSGTRGPNHPNLIYLVNRNGELVDTLVQPGEFQRGMYDLAWDGELLYGTDWGEILGFDMEGEIQVRFEAPFYYSRALTWDTDYEKLYVADARSDIVAVNIEGEHLDTLENPGLHIYGIAWLDYAEDGFNLHLFCRDGPNSTQINRINPETGDVEFVIDLAAERDERAGGLTFTCDWEPRYRSVIAQYVGGINRTTVYNFKRNDDWVRLEPAVGAIPAGRSLPVSIEFYARGFNLNDIAEGFITIDGHQRGGIDTINVIMRIVENSIPEEDPSILTPDGFNLTVFPNPFNDHLTVRYRSPVGSYTEVSIFDLQGRHVESVVQTVGDGYAHSVVFNGNKMSSGLYFVVLEAGERLEIRRVVMLR